MKWVAEPRDLQAPAGKPLHLPCLAEAQPAPKIEWFRGQEEDKREQASFLGSELTFNSLEPKDSGYYTCRASNGLEEDLVKQIKLDVLGK